MPLLLFLLLVCVSLTLFSNAAIDITGILALIERTEVQLTLLCKPLLATVASQNS